MTTEQPLGAQMTAGTVLAGRYTLVAPIATGGMAQVWRAQDSILGRQVAAKVLHPHLATDQAFLIRFRREAVAAARLSHRSIVAIYDTVSENGTEAIIMELVESRTMRAVLDEAGVLPLADVLDIGIQIAEALDEAHQGGVVHRDIKPSNILLCADRRVMVTDFGIAKAGDDTDLTVTGTLLGTAKYLSPEQVLGDEVDPRSDLYALGVVLYESLAGRAPFRAETDAATALARLHQRPRPLTEFRSDLPHELVAIIDRLLEREPEARWSRALDLRAALASVTRSAQSGAAPSGSPVTTGDHTQSMATAERDTSPIQTEPTTPPSDPPSPASNPALHEAELDELDDSFDRAEHRWILPAALVLLLAGALTLAGFLLTRPEASTAIQQSPSTDSTIPLTPTNTFGEPTIAGLATLDAVERGGDGDENDDLLPLAFDGDDDTAWRSDTYIRAGYAGLKPGVGLIVDLGGASVVEELDLETNTDAWAVSIYIGSDFSGDPDTWGDPIDSGADLDGLETFRFDSARGTHLLIWITEPGISPDRNDDDIDDFRFELEELSVS